MANVGKTYVQQLKENGYVVLPVLDAVACKAARAALVHEIGRSEEFKSAPVKDHKYTLGGFGALAHPSSFHTKIVRDLRYKTYLKFYEHIYEPQHKKAGGESLRVHAVIDRVLMRAIGDKATDESWHRDVAQDTDAGDTVYGGWINLDCMNDPQEQMFSTFKTTHIRNMPGLPPGDSKSGFATMNRAQTEKLNEMAGKPKNRKKRQKPTGSLHVVVKIPPGSMIVFNERIIHEVVGKATEHNVMRLFTGFVIGRGKEALTDKILKNETWKRTVTKPELQDIESGPAMPKSLDELIDKRCAAPLKSAQLPPFYPKMVFSSGPLFMELTGYEMTPAPKKTNRNETEEEKQARMAKRRLKPRVEPHLTTLYSGLQLQDGKLRCPPNKQCENRFLTTKQMKVPGSLPEILVKEPIMKRFAGGQRAKDIPGLDFNYSKLDRKILVPHQKKVVKRTRTPPQATGVKAPIKKHKITIDGVGHGEFYPPRSDRR